MVLESISSSVQRRIVKSKLAPLIFIIMLLYIAQLCYLAYTDQINTSMLVIEGVIFLKLILMYIYKQNDNENDVFSRNSNSSQSLDETEQKIESSGSEPVHEESP